MELNIIHNRILSNLFVSQQALTFPSSNVPCNRNHLEERRSQLLKLDNCFARIISVWVPSIICLRNPNSKLLVYFMCIQLKFLNLDMTTKISKYTSPSQNTYLRASLYGDNASSYFLVLNSLFPRAFTLLAWSFKTKVEHEIRSTYYGTSKQYQQNFVLSSYGVLETI